MRQVVTVLLAVLVLGGCAGDPAQPVVEVPARPPASAEPPPSPAKAVPRVATETEVMAAVDRENSLFFASGDSTISPEGRALLRRHAERLKSDPELHVTLMAFTDDLGSRVYNIAIADRRANAVYQVLRDFGVQPKQLRRYSAGAEMTSKACRSAACRRLMRRVELNYGD